MKYLRFFLLIVLFPLIVTAATYNDFDTNPSLSSAARKKMRPFLLPEAHPLKPVLDDIFLSSRATLNKEAFKAAGFHVVFTTPRSFIKIASHKALSGYLIKAYLDSEKRTKGNKPHWLLLAQRCEGAARIRHVIQKHGIKHFIVPDKWLYPLPIHPDVPNDPLYSRKFAILVVQRIPTASSEETLAAWREHITPEHLDELYTIIREASGSSYRPDNIPLTRDGKFAFIDTEYPDAKHPDFYSIKRYLSPKMKAYWNKLVKKGGKK